MRRNFLLLPLFLTLATGCVSTPPPVVQVSPVAAFPTEGFLVQRALLTAGKRQFTLNGYLALSPTGGQRLIVAENFGNVLADVLVKPDGKVFVMRSNRYFPKKYIPRFVVPDLECIFGGRVAGDCPVTVLEKNHFLIKRRGYTLDLRIVETRTGAQSPELFDETRAPKQ